MPEYSLTEDGMLQVTTPAVRIISLAMLQGNLETAQQQITDYTAQSNAALSTLQANVDSINTMIAQAIALGATQ